jgi:hypothetical protein
LKRQAGRRGDFNRQLSLQSELVPGWLAQTSRIMFGLSTPPGVDTVRGKVGDHPGKGFGCFVSSA